MVETSMLKCNLCQKQFSTRKQLAGHLSWHSAPTRRIKGSIDRVKLSESIKRTWVSLPEDKRQHQLRGLLSLTPKQHREQAQKAGETRRGRPSPLEGRTRTVEEREAISLAVKSALARIPDSVKQEWYKKISLANKGKPHSKTHNKAAWAGVIKANSPWLPWNGSRYQHPNKVEKRLNSLLQQIMPRQWLYVGNGKFIIDGKCPDFINVNGKKQVIELFGYHWHNIFDVAKVIDHYQQYGYSTLVIWEDELKNETQLARRIKKFMRQRNYADQRKP